MEAHEERRNFWGDPVDPAGPKPKLGEASKLYRRDCRFCGAPLGFGVTGGGNTIALDLATAVYCVTGAKEPEEDSGVVRTHLAFADHWSTCAKAREVKAARDKQRTGQP